MQTMHSSRLRITFRFANRRLFCEKNNCEIIVNQDPKQTKESPNADQRYVEEFRQEIGVSAEKLDRMNDVLQNLVEQNV
jgi:hypothetical protein